MRDALYDICREHQPLTVRQAFYRAVVAGVVEKTQKQYSNTVCRLLKLMRLEGELPWGWITDNTRWMRKPTTWGSLAGLLEHSQDFYRRSLWKDQNVYVEVWCESDSAAGVLYDVTNKWDVPLMAARGFSSWTFCRQAAQVIQATNKPTFLYYFGDYDPSGVHIDADIRRKLRHFGVAFSFERVAVTGEQVTALNLEGKPPKKTDSRAKSFDGDCVEIEAIAPGDLRQMCGDCITRHIDWGVLERTEQAESAERETLARFAQSLT